ncbi:hypothetical protein B0H16DRAFT_1474168 [Mycena metata]|uniref:Uncharacterized protein n=1 Tax=Mycena metata TaxID=1033252 RepID=A0AAD7MJV8_9AGAR|nr:hypothetical protein B0H16DRAFT_1474168 [Mycena metata]
MSWRFLDIFTLPALRTFQVAESTLQEGPVKTLQSLFSRSRCNVHELELYITESYLSQDAYPIELPTLGSLSFSNLDEGGEYVNEVAFLELDEEPLNVNAHAADESSTLSDEDDDESD